MTVFYFSISTVVAFATMLSLLVCRKSFALTITPVLVWVACLYGAMLNPFGFPELDYRTIYVILLHIFTLALSIPFGYWATSTVAEKTGAKRGQGSRYTVKKAFAGYTLAALVIIFSIYLARTIFHFLTYGPSPEYRNLAMGYGTDSVIFASSYEAFLFSTVVRGFLIVSLALALYMSKNGQGRLQLAVVAVLLLADCVITFGRYFVYILFVSIFCAAFAFRNRVSWLGTSIILIFSSATIWAISSWRSEIDLDIYQMMQRYIVGYHIVGPYLLDRVVTGELSYDRWYGGALISGFVQILTKPFELMGVNIETFLESKEAVRLSQPVILGEVSSLTFKANAFYTLLGDIIIDGGIFFLIVVSILLGIIYGGITALFSIFRSPRLFGLLLILYLIFFFAILKNQFSQLYFVFGLLFFIICPSSIYSRKEKGVFLRKRNKDVLL